MLLFVALLVLSFTLVPPAGDNLSGISSAVLPYPGTGGVSSSEWTGSKRERIS